MVVNTFDSKNRKYIFPVNHNNELEGSEGIRSTEEIPQISPPAQRENFGASSFKSLLENSEDMRNDAHNFPKKLEGALSSIKSSEDISAENKQIIIDFHQDCLANGLTHGRVLKYVYDLMVLSRWLGKSFRESTKDDIKKLVLKVNSATYRRNGMTEDRPYSEHSKRDFRVALKKVFKWMKGTDEAPDEVRWIRTEERTDQHKLPEDMLTEDEIKKLIDHTTNLRDKAFVAVLYESGCRIGELLFLKVKHVIFDEHGAHLVVQGKTGYRRVKIVSSAIYLAQWLNSHPDKTIPDSWVWIKSNSERIGYATVKDMLKQVAQRAGINKHVNPHNFRHSRATFLANHLTEAQMKEFFGWVQGSDVASVYVHLSGRDVDKALLKSYGIEDAGKEPVSNLCPKPCPRCQHDNSSTNKFCSNCSMVLDKNEEIALVRPEAGQGNFDSILDSILSDPVFRNMFIEKIKDFWKATSVSNPSHA